MSALLIFLAVAPHGAKADQDAQMAQKAAATAIEVLGGRKPTRFVASDDIYVYSDDVGMKLASYLQKPGRSSCSAQSVRLVPRGEIQTSTLRHVPQKLLGKGLQQAKVIINCRGGDPFEALVTFNGSALGQLSFIVEPD